MASDIYVKIGDIKGESQDKAHPDEIEIQSWSWGIANPSSPTGTGGLSAGKASFSDISLQMMLDKSATALELACATGKHYKDATLSARKSGGEQLDYMIVKMFDVLVTSVSVGQGSGSIPSVSVSLAYNKLEIEYKMQKPDGTLTPAGNFKYAVSENKTY